MKEVEIDFPFLEVERHDKKTKKWIKPSILYPILLVGRLSDEEIRLTKNNELSIEQVRQMYNDGIDDYLQKKSKVVAVPVKRRKKFESKIEEFNEPEE